ncbi:MAG: type II toxin-antitoxin system VapB family antitoxin [Nitrospirota bacterium]|nr:type II toxin-antitoxin system VapB family antitoxin [Nitrospirota bacterium]
MARIIIDIEDSVMKKAQEINGLNNKSEVVKYAIEKLVRQKEIEHILSLKGQIKWEGNLEEMRKGRYSQP